MQNKARKYDTRYKKEGKSIVLFYGFKGSSRVIVLQDLRV